MFENSRDPRAARWNRMHEYINICCLKSVRWHDDTLRSDKCLSRRPVNMPFNLYYYYQIAIALA